MNAPIYTVMNQTKRNPQTQTNSFLKRKIHQMTCNSRAELQINTPISSQETDWWPPDFSRMRPVTSMCPVDPPKTEGNPGHMQRGMLQPGAQTEGCRGQREQQEAWAKASRSKMRGTARLSHKSPLMKICPAIAHCPCSII